MTRASRSPAVVVVGDCLLDVGVRHPPIGAPGGDVPAAIWLSPGGGGANVAVRLARRGLPARLVAPVARDPAGQLLRASLRAEASSWQRSRPSGPGRSWSSSPTTASGRC